MATATATSDDAGETVYLSFCIFTSKTLLPVHLQSALPTMKDARKKQQLRNSHHFPYFYFQVTFSLLLPSLLLKLPNSCPRAGSLWPQPPPPTKTTATKTNEQTKTGPCRSPKNIIHIVYLGKNVRSVLFSRRVCSQFLSRLIGPEVHKETCRSYLLQWLITSLKVLDDKETI